jgi:hypothetical protein
VIEGDGDRASVVSAAEVRIRDLTSVASRQQERTQAHRDDKNDGQNSFHGDFLS